MSVPSVTIAKDRLRNLLITDRIIGLLEASGIRKNELLINRLRVDMVRRGDMMSYLLSGQMGAEVI